MSMRQNLIRLTSAIVLAAACATAQAQKAYYAAGFVDFTGPYAGIFSDWIQSREVTLAWWNKEVGSKLGVRIDLKQYDNRFDAAQTASLWPTVKAELNPILVYGVGAPDVVALKERLPDDRIALIMGTGGYGDAWKPDPWVFNPRPSITHELAAFLEWKSTSQNRPVRFALISSEASPGYVDIVKGMVAYAKGNKKVELVEILNTEMQPADLTLQVRRMANANVDYIVAFGNSAQVVAVKRALQDLKQKIPVLMSIYSGIQVSGKGMGGISAFEGDYEVCACALATEGDSPARRFYEMLRKDYGLKANWTSISLIGMAQVLYSMRAVERAIAKVGPHKLTGAAVREAMFSTTTSAQLFGILPSMTHTKEAAFSLAGATANVATVKGGKIVNVATEIPIPNMGRW